MLVDAVGYGYRVPSLSRPCHAPHSRSCQKLDRLSPSRAGNELGQPARAGLLALRLHHPKGAGPLVPRWLGPEEFPSSPVRPKRLRGARIELPRLLLEGIAPGAATVRHRTLDREWSTRGSPASIAARFGSSQGGSLSAPPRSGRASSTVNPGRTVATSKSTPPGSRK